MQEFTIISQLKKYLIDLSIPFPWKLTWNEQMKYVLLSIDFNFHFNDLERQNYQFKEVFHFLWIGKFSDLMGIQNCVKVFQIDEDTGIKDGELLATVKYIKFLLQEVKALCLERVIEQNTAKIEMIWDHATFLKYRQGLINTHRYNEKLVQFYENGVE